MLTTDPESNVILTIGPPGCGKTTALAESAKKAVRRYQDNKALVIVSLTNTAAHEIASRGLPVVKEQVGTLHAICYRQMDRPDLVGKHLREWNQEYQHYAMAVPRRVATPEDDEEYQPPPEKVDQGGKGDVMVQRYDLLRHQMFPREAWPVDVLHFATQWEAWKRGNDLVDFTDMIERYYLDFDSAPFGAQLLMADESQDFSKLEFATLMKMSRHMDYTLICGDEDQSLYDWRGANPANLIDLRPRRSSVLEQSYRLPPAIHAYCQTWIQQVSRRLEKAYRPYLGRGDGAVEFLQSDWRVPYELVTLSEQAERAGKSLMILAACGYHLDPLIKRFRAEGIPFANPYRPNKSHWNPLMRPPKKVATVDRVMAFLAPQDDPTGRLTWTWEEMALWAPLVRVAGVFEKHAKTRLTHETPPRPDAPMALEDVLSLLDPCAAQPLLDGNMVWLLDHVVKAHEGRLDYFARVHQRSGAAGLAVPVAAPTPGVPTVGTIHSVKGGEADWVYVFPDVSFSGYKSLEGSLEARDSVLRQFYVGVSRAKETLFLGGSGNKQAVMW